MRLAYQRFSGKAVLACLAAAGLWSGCELPQSGELEAGEGPNGVVVLAAVSELPNCNLGHRGIVYYIEGEVAEDEGQFFYCDGSAHHEIDLHGLDGVSWLVETTAEDTGCLAGGVTIKAGLDANRDGVIDGEPTSKDTICNGEQGPPGEPGVDGVSCWDLNGNGVCEPAEDADGNDLCDTADCQGADGATGPAGLGSLVQVTNEPAGSNCQEGGAKIDAGIDLDGDAQLDPEEVETTQYVCNGVAKLANGSACSSDVQCTSGYCTDGVCCDKACVAGCEACNVAGSVGTCTSHARGTDPELACGVYNCSGNGACLASGTSGNVCSPTHSSDCKPGYYCYSEALPSGGISLHTCVQKGPLGESCTQAYECSSGHCEDGVCCDQSCEGACQSCTWPGQEGTCINWPLGTDPENDCGLFLCDGNGACVDSCDPICGGNQCKTSAWCSDNTHTCVEDLAGGKGCLDSCQCESGVCLYYLPPLGLCL
jgi:hypothetical protein